MYWKRLTNHTFVCAIVLALLLTSFYSLFLPSSAEARPLCRWINKVQPIESGFGANGSYTADKTVIYGEKFGREVHIWLPAEATGPVPLIVYAHGFYANNPDYYSATLEHIVSRGNAVVFPTYHSVPVGSARRRYKQIADGVETAIQSHSENFDLNKIGLMGHSFGASSLPWLANYFSTALASESLEMFIFAQAPWYAYEMDDDAFAALPSSINTLIQVYADDNQNDHRMAIDIYNAIPSAEKDYVVVHSDSEANCYQSADHFAPNGKVFSVNGLDWWAIDRRFDALAAYTFEGDEFGRLVALGHNDPAQENMGTWGNGHPVTAMQSLWVNPQPMQSESFYLYPFSDAVLNPRFGGD